MTAFRRRTAFAAPLIVIAGCGGKDAANDPSKPAFAGHSWTVWKQGDKCRADVRIGCPPKVACNPPAPREIECPGGATETTTVIVVEKPDKTCAIVPDGCSELACATQATACPAPYQAAPPPEKLVAIWSIHRGRNSPDACEAFDELACSVPPNQPAPPCNPPPPMPVACPTGWVPDKPMQIGQLPNGKCAVVVPGCKHATCVDQAIDCPAPAAE
jgi:hypothetical protein